MFRSNQAILLSLLVWCAIALLAGWSVWSTRPPAPVPASAALQLFSADRAMSDVRAIARVPHPTGSPGQDAVRKYLIDRLTSLGFDPQVYSATGIRVNGTSILAGNTSSIVGRLRGAANSRAVLLMAHYDSVPNSDGAADDAASIAAILESLRAVRAGAPLKNDVIVLFTDGEDAGLLGAEAFVSSHPFFKDVGLVMNFETRGNSGPSVLFETSAGNSRLIDEVRRGAPQMVGSSLFYSLYKTLPYDTDLTVFGPSGLPRLNFAFGGGLQAHHSPLDTPDNLSVASLQLHGTYALHLTQHFGQLDLESLRTTAADDVFFNLPGKELVTYSQAWTGIGEGLITLLLFASVVVPFRRSLVKGRSFALSFLAVVSFAFALPMLMAAAWWLISSLLGERLLIGDAPSNSLMLVGLILLGATVTDLVFGWFSSSFSVVELFLAALTFIWMLSWPLVLFVPTASYLLQLPLLVFVLALSVSQLWKDGTLFVAAVPGAICTVLLFAPLLYLLYVFLTLGYVVVATTGFLLAIAFLLSIALFEMPATRPRPWFVTSGALAALSVSCIVIGAARSHYSVKYPKPDNLLYSVDADHHSAAWMSFDGTPDQWVSITVPPETRRRERMLDYLVGSVARPWEVSAFALNLPYPLIVIAKEAVTGDIHDVILTVRSQRDVNVLYATLGPGVTILSGRIAGRDIPLNAITDPGPGVWAIKFYGWGQKGIPVELQFQSNSSPLLRIADESSGLPPLSSSRPPNLIASHGSDVTLVNRRMRLK
jgi:hypothetical protein